MIWRIALAAWLTLLLAVVGQQSHAQFNGCSAGFCSRVAGGSSSTLKTGLISFWEFQNTSWLDATATGNTLTANAAPTSVAGLVGNAVSFVAASSQFLSHVNNASLQIGGGSFSVQAWINPTSVTGQGTIASKSDGGFANKEWWLGTNFTTSNVWSWNLYDTTSGNQLCNSTVTAVTGSWTHLVITWDGTTQKIYVNNASPGTNVPALPGLNTTSSFMIGKNGDSGAFFDGLEDQFGIWSRALTSAEVTQLYNGGAGLSYAGM